MSLTVVSETMHHAVGADGVLDLARIDYVLSSGRGAAAGPMVTATG